MRLPGISARAVVQALLLQGLLCLGLLCLLATPVDHLDVVVEDSCNDWHEVCFDDSGTNILRATDADIDHTLEGEVPLPHVHHVLAPPLLQDTYQPLNAAIDS